MKDTRIKLTNIDFDTSRLIGDTVQLWSWGLLECPAFSIEDAKIAVNNYICYVASDTSICRISSDRHVIELR